MQTLYIVEHIKNYAKAQRVIEDWQKKREVAKYHYKVLCFYDKHGLDETLDAFNISRRTLFRWRAKLKYTKRVIVLKPGSSRPITFRASGTNPLIIKKIERLEKYIQIWVKIRYFICKNLEITAICSIAISPPLAP